MAGKVKGITIEFRGETTKLDKAIKDVNKETAKLDAELKQVNNALKFNPKNTELMAQKQQILTQKVSATEDKLNALRAAEEKMAKDKNIDKNSAEWRELQREIITTDSKLSHYKKELDKLRYVKLTALGKQFEDVGKKVKNAGDSITKYITGPIAAAGTASGAAWQTTQDALNEVTKLTGASGQDLQDMQDIVKDLAETMPADMHDIATAVGEVNTRFGLTGDALEDTAEQFVKFSQINGTDVTNSIDQVQKAMSAFGLDAEDTSYVLDVLTKTSQDTGVSVDKLTSGLISNGTAFQEMNLDLTQSALLMGQLEKSGVNMETVTNGMRKALKTAAKEGRPVNEVLAELQDTILNDTTGVEGLQAAYDVFGKSGDQIYGAIKAGTLDFKALGMAADDSAGILDQTFDAVQTPAQQFQKILNQLKLLGYDVAQAVLPVVSKALDKVMKAIDKLNTRWNTIAPETQKKIIAITLAIAAIGPALSIVGKVMTGFGKIMQNVGTIIGGFSKALSFLAANPIVLVIAGITALIAAIVLLWNKSEKFRDFFTGIWDTIKAKVTAFKTGFKEAKDAVVSQINALKDKATELKDKFIDAKDKIVNGFKSIPDKFKEVWNRIGTGLKNLGSTIGNAVLNAIKGGINGVISTVENVINKAIDKINAAITWANKVIPGSKHDIGSVSHVSLPRLARGGIVDSATLALIGEGSSSEAVVPLDEMWRKMAKMINGGGDVINITVNGAAGQSVEELAAAVERRLISAQKRRTMAWA